MKRKNLLFALLVALFMPWAANAQETVTIGNGTSTDYYTPIGTYYNYSITEQLYTADEIGMAGTINSISFDYASTTAKDFPITVYMANVEAEDLSTGISLADAHEVFNGTLSVTGAGWATIELDSPFTYDGTSNLLIGINKDYVYYYSGNWNHTATEAVMARYTQNDNNAYTTSTVPGTTRTSRPNIQMVIIPSGGSVCAKPETLVAENITTDGATLTWTGGSGVYNIELNGTVIEESYEGYTYNLADLSPATNYTVRLQSVCDDATSGWKTVSFTTECDVIPALGYTENFDSYSGVTSGTTNNLPLCWNYINESTNSTYQGYPVVYANTSYSTYANSAPNCLRFYAYGSTCTDQYAILPEMEGLNGKQIILQAKGYNNGNAFKIGMMTDPMDATTFVEIAEQTLTTSYQEFEFILGEGNHVAIMMEAPTGSTTVGVYVDDIVISEAPTCIKPTELTVTGVSTTTATLGWTNGTADQTAWQICLNGDETNLILAESNPFTIEDLTAATSYTAKVRAYCSEDDQSEWSNEVSFTTLCEAITTFPWTETFNNLTEAASIPNCWDNSEGTTTNASYKWSYNTKTSGNGMASNGHEGSCVVFDSYNNSSNNTNFLKTVSLSLPSDQLMQLSFWYKNPTGGDFSVYISTDGGATHETALATGLTGVSTWTELTISLADYAGQEVVIVFKGTSNYGYGDAYIYLDDITVMEVPTCLKPNGLEVTATTTTTATLSWTAGANETAWQICLNGDETNLIMAESNPFTVEDLTASTAYTAKVRAYCSADDQSDWSNEVSFATECEAIVVDAANPFTEDFEGDWTPLCWESIPYIDGTTTRQWTKTTSSSNIHTGAGAAYSGYYGPIYLVMPDLQLGTDGDAVQLTFWSYNSFVSDYDKNSIVLLDGENEVELWSPESVFNSWEEVTIDLTAYMGQTISLAFKYEGNNAHGWYVDDVEVTMMKTFTKHIIGYASSDEEGSNGNNYYLIASPLADAVAPTTVGGMITDNLGVNATPETSTYDLYRFDEALDLEWINYRGNENDFSLVNGQAYLYASKNGTDLTFIGTPYSGDTKEVTLQMTENENADFQGWNLVGNPFAEDAYIVREYFYVMDGNGAEIIAEENTSRALQPMEGIFVVADHDGEEITFTKQAPGAKANIVLNLTQGRGNTIDRAIVGIGQGRTLPKFMLNPNNTKLYIPQNGEDYAAVRSLASGEIPVSFVPAEDGYYNISVDVRNMNLRSLILKDYVRNVSIDLLRTPNYMFKASVYDRADRFVLMFRSGNSIYKEKLVKGANPEDFSFYSNGVFVIDNEGEATLQVIDLNGRVLSSENIYGSTSIQVDAAPGVYMLRLVNGDDVKTQKVVVK